MPLLTWPFYYILSNTISSLSRLYRYNLLSLINLIIFFPWTWIQELYFSKFSLSVLINKVPVANDLQNKVVCQLLFYVCNFQRTIYYLDCYIYLVIRFITNRLRYRHLKFEVTVARNLQSKVSLVEITGIEPATPCVQGRCSPDWAISPGIYFFEHQRHSKLNSKKHF